jgi:hypothetical protein
MSASASIEVASVVAAQAVCHPQSVSLLLLLVHTAGAATMTLQSGKVLNLDEIYSNAKGKCCLSYKEVCACATAQLQVAAADSCMNRGTVTLMYNQLEAERMSANEAFELKITVDSNSRAWVWSKNNVTPHSPDRIATVLLAADSPPPPPPPPIAPPTALCRLAWELWMATRPSCAWMDLTASTL